ncbi:MAG: peptide-binding protein [Phycisphaerales bacterium]|nr:peptide-binding protein [Phycisphaerales bacterium]
MDNRFGVKDFVLFLLVGLIAVLFVVKMVQDDRQWDQLRQANTTLQSHTRDLTRITNLLREGVPTTSPTTQPSDQPVGSSAAGQDDAFERIRQAHAQPDYAEGDFFINADQTPPDRLTPIISADLFSATVQSYVLESLIDRDPDTLQWKPKVARSFQVSQDGLTIDFELRRDVVFSDGSPLTADDVVWTYNWIMNPEVQAPRQRIYYEKIAQVQSDDPYHVRFIFKEPYFLSLSVAGGLEILPRHFYEKYTPDQFNTSVGLLMGSGPYRLADSVNWRPEPGKPIELVRNERYWGPAPSFDRIIWRIIENPAARLTAFRNGEIDRLGALPEQYVQLLKDEELRRRVNNYEMMLPASGYMFIGWNEKRNGQATPFADQRVRQAMTMLIDRQAIIDQVLLGYGNIATGPFNPLGKQNDPSIKPWPYDPQRAIALLKEAGFSDRNGDGVIDTPEGQPFHFEISYPSTSTTLERVALQAKDSLQRAGILAEPRPTEWSVLLERMDQRDFDASILGWGGTIESDIYQMFSSTSMAGTGDNNVQYSNPRLDEVMSQARRTVDEEARNKLWHEAHAILHEDQPYTFLFNSKALMFVDKRFHNIQRVRTGLNPLLEWYVPEDQQKWTH